MGTIKFVQRVNSIQGLLQEVTFMGKHLQLSSDQIILAIEINSLFFFAISYFF